MNKRLMVERLINNTKLNLKQILKLADLLSDDGWYSCGKSEKDDANQNEIIQSFIKVYKK